MKPAAFQVSMFQSFKVSQPLFAPKTFNFETLQL